MLRALTACALALMSLGARAAESYDGCKGTITSLPVNITTQGVWCLRADLATAITSGTAITIATNNVTLDCNGFKLGGLSAGPETTARGVVAVDRTNVTIRNCSIRGFLYGVSLSQGSGHVVEDNRFDANTLIAVSLSNADTADVRRNTISNTGGTFNPGSHDAQGISAFGGRAVMVRDNFISLVSPHTGLWPDAWALGISVSSPDSVIEGNRIAGVISGDTGLSIGISAPGTQMVINNSVSGLVSGTLRRGLSCGSSTISTRNLVSSAAPGEAFANCADDGGNVAR